MEAYRKSEQGNEIAGPGDEDRKWSPERCFDLVDGEDNLWGLLSSLQEI